MAVYTEIHLRRDSTLNWYASNPRLALGEPGIDLTLHRFKIGNGIDRWNDLPYMDDDLYKLLDKQQQAMADYVRDLLNKIAANKLDADQKHNALTSEIRNTSRDLTGRMSAVENEQREYQEVLTQRQQKFEGTVTSNQTEYQKNLTERQREFEEAVTGDFEDTKAEVHAGLDEFNETRDSLTARMNVIVGQLTEDTEILDARVDAESHTHPNLGENIRNIHSEVLKAQQAGDKEKTARIAADEAEKAERIAADEQLHAAGIAELSMRSERHSEHEEFLQEQINETASEVVNSKIELYEETRARKHVETVQQEHYQEFLTEQEERRNEDSRHSKREDEIEESSQQNTVSTREKLSAQLEHFQEQADELSGLVMSEMLQNRENLQAVQEDIQLEARERSRIDYQIRESIAETAEYLQKQTDELAGEVLRQGQEDYRLIAETEKNLDRLREAGKISSEYLQEQANDAASAILQNTLNQQEQAQKQAELRRKDTTGILERLEEQQEEINDLAQASLQSIATLQQETGKIRADTARERQGRTEYNARLQEGIEANTTAILRHLLDFVREAKKHRADLENLREADIIASDIHARNNKGLQEQINELAYLILSFLFSNRRAREKIDTRFTAIETVLVETGLLDDDYIPPTTETEIDSMFEDIFSGNTSGEAIVPEDEEEAEFLEDINNIFNP